VTAFIPPGQDIDAVEAEVQARLQATIPALLHIENGEEIDDDFIKVVNQPAALTMISRETSEGRATFNSPKQIVSIELSIGVVKGSHRSRLGVGSASLRRAITQSITGQVDRWKPAAARRAFVFIEREVFARVGTRSCQALRFKTDIQLS
jgi:hypothetical protein